MKIIDEFKEFAIRGNAVDLAVGIIIGAGFSKIVTSLVDDVIMPPLGLLVGNVDFSTQEIVIRAATETSQAVAISYGIFISTIIEFAIIAFAIFLVVRYLNSLKQASADEASDQPSARTCPFCKEGIASSATRCPHCTTKLKAVK